MEFRTELALVDAQENVLKTFKNLGTNFTWMTSAVNASNLAYDVTEVDDPDLPTITSGGVFNVVLDTNNPPVANDDRATTDGSPVTIDVLANDGDVDGALEPAFVDLTGSPANGVVSVDPVDGSLVYTPNPGFVGTDIVRYTVQDDSGEASNEATVVITVGTAGTAGTVVSLKSSNPATVYGQTLTFTAIVSAITPGLPTPTGSIEFFDGVTGIATVQVGANGLASLDVSDLPAGDHTITAVYSGDPNFTTSTAPDLSLSVARARLTVRADDQAMAHGDVVPDLTYTISGFVNGDSPVVVTGAPIVTTTATSASSAGRYPIVIKAGSLSAENYLFDPLEGALWVHPKVLDVRLRYGSQSVSLSILTRDLPFSTISAIDVIFSDNVAVELGQLSLTGVNRASYNLSRVSYDSPTHNATWTLPSALGVDRFLMALDGATFADDHTISVSPFNMSFAVLPGDINGDGAVNSQDMVLARNAIQGTGDPSMIGWADIDGDGVPNVNDLSFVRKRLGTHL
jgi:hypothetical protein